METFVASVSFSYFFQIIFLRPMQAVESVCVCVCVCVCVGVSHPVPCAAELIHLCQTETDKPVRLHFEYRKQSKQTSKI